MIVLEAALSAAIVGAVFLVLGAIFVTRGASVIRNLDLVPRQTVQTITDDRAWVKEHV